jgi:hypothetical protein
MIGVVDLGNALLEQQARTPEPEETAACVSVAEFPGDGRKAAREPDEGLEERRDGAGPRGMVG